MASFIELIAKIKQKNNGTFKLVDAQDVECEDGKGLDEVLNEKLDKNQGIENVGKTMVVGDDGNLVVGDSSPKNVYTKEEVDYLLDDKMDKPYVPIEITDNATITDALEGNFKIDKIKGNTYQNVETDIVPIPNRPVPINSRKVKVNSEYVELRSLKETGNLFDINFIKLWGNYSDGMTILDDGTVKITNNDAILWPLKTKSITIPKSANYTIKYDFETISGGANSGWISLVNMSNDNPKIFLTSGKTLYLDAGDYYVRFYRGQGATDVENNIVQYSNIVLVEGTSAPSTYVAPTVRDYKIVDHTNKTSKIVRNINQFELPTDFSWNDTDYYPNITGNVIPEDKKGVYDTGDYNLINYTIKQYLNYSNVTGTYLGFSECDRYWELNNSDEVNAFLTRVKEDGKPFIFQYQLATPVEEPITYVETDVSEVGYSWQDTTSPSPTIKSEVKGVEEIDILKTGKNLFDINDEDLYLLEQITHSDNVINKNHMSIKPSIKLKNLIIGKEYTVSYSTKLSIPINNQMLLCCISTIKNEDYPNGRVIYKNGAGKTDYNVEIKFTATQSEMYLIFSVRTETITNLQLEQGDTATAYEPYTEQRVNITLPQPMYQGDVANVESGNYEYEEQKYIVTGDEEFQQDYQSNAGYYGRYFNLKNGNGVITEKIWCNYLSHIRGLWSLASEGCSQNARNQIHLKFSNDRLGITDNTSLEEKRLAFANYLKRLYASGNPLYVVVKVAKTTQLIPEEDLIKIKSLKTEQGVTNIFVGGEVKPTIEARYPRDLALVQQQLEQKILLISDSLIDTQAKVLLQGGN